MDFTTFKKAVNLLSPNISVIMRGNHGIGKSEVVRQLSQEFNLPIIERRLSQLTEGDLIGLPFNLNDKVTKFLPPDWFASAVDKPYMIFLDEFDRAGNEVQQAAMELILDRSIQGLNIHPECRVYAAINGGKDGSMYKVNNIDPAINDRFWIADCTPSIQEWIEWGENKGGIIPEIINFISSNNHMLEVSGISKDVHKITPSRRSWTRLSNVLKNNSSIIDNLKTKNGTILFIALCSGFIGTEATSVFKSFLMNPENHIFAEDILDNFSKNEEKFKKFKVEHLNLAIDKIINHSRNKDKPVWSMDQVLNVDKFFRLLSSELRMSMWEKLTASSDAKIENAKALSNYVSDLIIEIINS